MYVRCPSASGKWRNHSFHSEREKVFEPLLDSNALRFEIDLDDVYCSKKNKGDSLVDVCGMDIIDERQPKKRSKISDKKELQDIIQNIRDTLKSVQNQFSDVYKMNTDCFLLSNLGDLVKKVQHKSYLPKGDIMSTLGKNRASEICHERLGQAALSLKVLEENTRQGYLSSVHSLDEKSSSVSLRNAKYFPFIRSFSLKYNEGSLCTIAKWSSANIYRKSSKSKDGSFVSGISEQNEAVMATTSKPLPMSAKPFQKTESSTVSNSRVTKQLTVDARFRKCCFCNLWGHYEIECSDVTYNNVALLARKMKKFTKSLHLDKMELSNRDKTNEILDIQSRIVQNEKKNLRTSKCSPSSRLFDENINKMQSNNFRPSVHIEFFQGFLIEQRSEPEKVSRIKSTSERRQSIQVNFDDSFELDGFKISASTSLERLQDGKKSSFKLSSKEGLKNNTKIDGANSSAMVRKTMTESHNRARTRPYNYQEGDVVAWYNYNNDQYDGCFGVCTGLVVQAPNTKSPIIDDYMERTVGIEFLAFVPSSPGFIKKVKPKKMSVNTSRFQASKTSTMPLCTGLSQAMSEISSPTKKKLSFGSLVWIPEAKLHLVQEEADITLPEDLRMIKPKKRVYRNLLKSENEQKKLKPSILEKMEPKTLLCENVVKEMLDESPLTGLATFQAKNKTHNERSKKTGRLHTTDMTLAPRKTAKLLANGSYATPQGRRPVGLQWDSVRGVWSLPRKKISKGKAKQMGRFLNTT